MKTNHSFSFLNQIDRRGFQCSVKGKPATDKEKQHFESVTVRDDEHFKDMSEPEQIIVRKWLSYNLLPAQSVLSGHTSYGMKHILESRTGIYMTNNQFKEAMMECGFFPVVVDELNWRFRIKKSSPMFTIQTDGKCGLPMLGKPMRYDS